MYMSIFDAINFTVYKAGGGYRDFCAPHGRKEATVQAPNTILATIKPIVVRVN